MSHAGRIAALAGLSLALTGAVAGTVSGATAVTPAIDVRFATVTAAGDLVAAQSLGATSALRAAQGKFKITFDASLARCAVSAASLAGNTSTNIYGYDTRIMTLISGSSLYVTLMSRSDGPGDYPFSVVLACKERIAVVQPAAGGAVKPGAGGAVRPGAGGAIKPGGAGPGAGAGAGAAAAGALDGMIRFATVTATGDLVAAQSYGAASALRAAQGKFKIVFDASLAGCAVGAASLAGNTSTNIYGYDTRIMTLISGSSLYVTLMSRSDGPGDYPFSVVLACNP